jgi:lysozyme
MSAPEDALALIRSSEGLSLKAYLCPAGKWTIGYGHTEGVTSGMVIDAAAAETLLAADVAALARNVDKLVSVTLTPNQRSALLSFVYNIGLQAFSRSRLLQLLNSGDTAAVPAELKRWVYTRGRILNGLVIRRAREAALWKRESTKEAT